MSANQPATRRAALLTGGLTLGLSLVLSGCGQGQDNTASAPTVSTTSTAPGFNESDVAFARDAVALQRQAVAMAAMASTRTNDPGVLALAARVRSTQTRWNGTMRQCLNRWGNVMPRGMMGSSAAGGMMSGTTGMMSRHDLDGLASQSGHAFDREFLTRMEHHHVAMMDLAGAERAHGLDPAAMMQARRMQQVQGTQLHTMRRMMRR